MHDATPIPWLLAARSPPIRHLTQRLLCRPEGDADVQGAAEITASGPILTGRLNETTGRSTMPQFDRLPPNA
jgi:hypothetical protein